MTTSEHVLYWEALSGAIAPQAMFEEMGVPFQKRPVDMAREEHKTPEYMTINPTGQVPALKLPDGSVISESAAIVLALGERYPQSRLVPNVGEADRAGFLRWLIYMATTGYMTSIRANHPERFTIDDSGIEAVRRAAIRDVGRCFDVLENAIEGTPYFLPRGFTALDIYLCMLTVFHPDRPDLSGSWPRMDALCRAVRERPACARVFDEHMTAQIPLDAS
jgi:glutathione S-transferase